MPHQSFFFQTISNLEHELQENGCLDFPSGECTCTLKCPIHPLLELNRWARGYDQYTEKCWPRMRPALQLASLFLTEDCMLPWFEHVASGRLKTRDSKQYPKVYIDPVPSTLTKERIQRVKQQLRDMAEVTTFMFTPRKYKNTGDGQAWGATSRFKNEFDWCREFRREDMPYIDNRYRIDPKFAHRGRPCISLSYRFQDYFCKGQERANSRAQDFRISLLFAVTIVHEIAHAYWMYLGRSHSRLTGHGEPYWNLDDKEAELGFSWEAMTIGRILSPAQSELNLCTILYSMLFRNYRERGQRRITVSQLVDRAGVTFRDVPLPPPHKFDMVAQGMRSNTWFCRDGGRAEAYYLVIIHAIPIKWVADWFLEEEWERKRRVWRQTGKFSPPPLGPTFMLVYARNPDGWARLRYSIRDDADPYLEDVRNQAESMGCTESIDRSGIPLLREYDHNNGMVISSSVEA
ncbi:hypothetical protein CC78DRAFT_126081 [Lojkania enalia]|uniref:Uncharacterized protein n=1 Tax=Lojkania enalia TaxID=147567 RepID=A0A9P4JZ37_9PLEO|nr:hypothetical protein CC78DRAFT_126081 [Didymosphaeria enalia]